MFAVYLMCIHVYSILLTVHNQGWGGVDCPKKKERKEKKQNKTKQKTNKTIDDTLLIIFQF